MSDTTHAQTITYDDTWLLDGARTAFADYNSLFKDVSATDLGIKAAREALARTGVKGEDIDAVVTSNVAQTSFDAFFISATSASMRDCLSAFPLSPCSGCAPRGSKRSCRAPTDQARQIRSVCSPSVRRA